MNVKNLEKKEKNTAEITVEVSAEEFDAAVNKAYLKNRSRISIPGFRKGKAPRKIIENMYGASVFYEDALDELYTEAFAFSVLNQDLNIVGQPTLLDVNINDDKSVTIVYQVAVYPEVKLSEYKGLEAPKQTVNVLKADIEEELENVRKRNARIQAVDRAAKIDDIVNIDYEGFMDGVPFEGGKDSGYDLTLGSGYFVPGFEFQLVGVKAGDEKDVNIVFPEDYQENLAGKPAVFKVKVNEVKESLLPDLDDEFAKDVSEFDTLEEYKASIKENISNRKKAAAENAFRDAIMTKLIDGMEADIPDAMVEERVQSTIDNYNQRLSAQGMDFPSYLNMLGMDIDSFREMGRASALREIQEEVALDKIADIEDLGATPEEIEAEFDRLAEQYDVDKDAVKQGVSVDTVVGILRRDKAAELLYAAAVVENKAADKAEEKSDEEEEKENTEE